MSLSAQASAGPSNSASCPSGPAASTTTSNGTETYLQTLGPTIELLNAFYAQVTFLEALLPAGSIRSDDTPAFKALVRGTVVAAQEKVLLSKSSQADLVASEELSVKEVVQRAQATIFRQHAVALSKPRKPPPPGKWVERNPPNILVAGYVSASNFGGANAVKSVCPNTVLEDVYRSLEWQTLLLRIGHIPLYQLLSSPSAAIFTPLPNACFLQVSGQRISDVKPRYWNLKRPLPTEESNVRQGKKGRRCDRSRKRGNARRKAASAAESGSAAADAEEVEVTQLEDPYHPTKRRKLGPAVSAPQLGDGGGLMFSTAGTGRSPLRPTQSLNILRSPTKGKNALKRVGEDFQFRLGAKRRKEETLFKSGEVVMSRTRMFHARPSRAGKGKITYGFPPQHIFSRLPALFPPPSPTTASAPLDRARHLAKYVFPRQFGLFNSFTSEKPAKGYAPSTENRSAEIEKMSRFKSPARVKALLPLLDRLLRLHGKFKFRRVLDQCCPTRIRLPRSSPNDADVSADISVTSAVNCKTQTSLADISLDVSHSSLIVPGNGDAAADMVRSKPNFEDFEIPPREVERYIHAVITAVIPREFWGSKANEITILRRLSDFTFLRRFEGSTVHSVLQGFSVLDCDWLRPKSAADPANYHQKPGPAEIAKRVELLSDFLYWVFDGFVIELLKTTFHMTEASGQRNRILFFRQDDWIAVCRPLWANIIRQTFQQLPKQVALNTLSRRTLKFSYARLLPKQTGARPIVNLQMRTKTIHPNGQMKLAPSINKQLEDVFQALTYEKSRNPSLLGAAVDLEPDIYRKLKAFKAELLHKGFMPRLYFVKVDVRSCFDTIKQDKVVQIVKDALEASSYTTRKYEQVSRTSERVIKRWPSRGAPEDDQPTFPDLADTLAEALHNTILVDKVDAKSSSHRELVRLLTEHVTNNLVKIDGKFYRQKDGIPQGSVLSSLLCNFFYGHMENSVLSYTKGNGRLLLRYIDDFLFITMHKSLANRFLLQMSGGIPEYGCSVAAEKGLTNFDATTDGSNIVPILASSRTTDFPFCGLVIGTKTLDVRAETARYEDIEMANRLTVEKCRAPGAIFLNKMLKECRRRTHPVYTDTSSAFNTIPTAYLNAYQSFLFVALKFRVYVAEWGTDPRRRRDFFIGVIEHLRAFMWSSIRNRARLTPGAKCGMRRTRVLWLGSHAFHRVLSKKPAAWYELLRWLRHDLRERDPGGKAALELRGVVGRANNDFIEGVVEKRKV